MKVRIIKPTAWGNTPKDRKPFKKNDIAIIPDNVAKTWIENGICIEIIEKAKEKKKRR